MAVYDFENVLDDVKSILSSNLNTKIAEINAEKNDGITMPTINNNAYFFQTLDERVTNFDPFLVYSIDTLEGENDYGRSQMNILINNILIIADNGKDSINRILFRYLRALNEIWKENFQSTSFSNRYKISSFTPVPFESLDTSTKYKGIGVIIETNMAT